jgi:hypothetical protein
MPKSATRQANPESITRASCQVGAISFMLYYCASQLCNHRALAKLNTALGVFIVRPIFDSSKAKSPDDRSKGIQFNIHAADPLFDGLDGSLAQR